MFLQVEHLTTERSRLTRHALTNVEVVILRVKRDGTLYHVTQVERLA